MSGLPAVANGDIGAFENFFYPVRSGEAMIEMMYQTQWTKWWTVQPEVQYIIRSGGGVLNPGDGLRPNAWVMVLRSTISF
jgi:porin